MKTFSLKIIAFISLLTLAAPLFAQAQIANYTFLPKNKQLYQRSLTTDSAVVRIAGQVVLAGFDSAIVRITYPAGIQTLRQKLNYTAGVASFNFLPKIKAQLFNHNFQVIFKSSTSSFVDKTITEVVSGDSYLLFGQSNAVASFALSLETSAAYKNSFLRSFGTTNHLDTNLIRNDLNWYEAEGDNQSSGGVVGQWGLVMAKKLSDARQIPIAVINGSVGGRSISYFQRKNTNPFDIATNYGRLLYRSKEANLQNNYRAVLFYQGESDGFNNYPAASYVAAFDTLYNALKNNYPSIQKIYVVQVRQLQFIVGSSSCNINAETLVIAECQRNLPNTYADVNVLSVSGIERHDGCHFKFINGYEKLGTDAAAKILKDLYNTPNTPNIEPPNIKRIYFANLAKSQVVLEMKSTTDNLVWQSGSQINFRFEGSGVPNVVSGYASGRNYILNLSSGFTTNPANISHVGHAGVGPSPVNGNGIGLLRFYNQPILPKPNSPPAPNFTHNPPFGFINTTNFAFNALSSTDTDGVITNYAWNFGDGSIAMGIYSAHTYTQPGLYNVSLCVRDDSNAVRCIQKQIRVFPAPNVAPTAAFNINPTFGYRGSTNFLMNGSPSSDPDGTLIEYRWNFGDGSPIVTGQTVNHVYAAAGLYAITLTVKDDSLATNFTSRQVRVFPPRNVVPTATFTASTTSGFAPLAVNFNAALSSDPDGSIIEYRWNFGDGSPVGLGQTINHTFASVGLFNVVLTVKDDSLATHTFPMTIVTQQAPNISPVARIIATPTVGFPGLLVQFNGRNSNDPDGSLVKYEWDFGDGSPNSLLDIVSHIYLNNGIYFATLTVTDNLGATHSATQQITVNFRPNRKPVAMFTMRNNSGFAPLLVQFDGSSSVDSDGVVVSYAWNFGDNSTGNGLLTSHIYQQTGVFNPILKVTDNKGADSSIRLGTVLVVDLLATTNDKPIESSVYPNPSGGMTNFVIKTQENDFITLDLFDELGQNVAQIYAGQVQSNYTRTVVFDVSTLRQGTYYYRITSSNYVSHHKLAVIR